MVRGLKVESFVNPWSFVFYILEALVCKKPTKSIVYLFLYLSLSVNKNCKTKLSYMTLLFVKWVVHLYVIECLFVFGRLRKREC